MNANEDEKEADSPDVSALATTVTADVLAKLFNLTTVRIRQLANEGPVVRAGRAKYDLWASVKGYVRFLQGSAAGKMQSGSAYEIARTRLTSARADEAEISAALTKGDVHDADVVREFWADMIQRAKTRITALPSKAAPQLESCETVAERKAMLEVMVNEALCELADYDGREITNRWAIKNRRAIQADGGDVEAAAEVDGERVGGRAAAS